MSEDKWHPKVKQSISLDGDQQTVKDFYAHWAKEYDKDTQSWQYCGCNTAYRLLTTLPPCDYLSIDNSDKTIRIMDVGCGTGLMGVILYEHGYRHIDGCDLSLEMTLQADKLGIYNELTADIDINQPINPDWKDVYDVSVSIGVFTPGHVDPTALNQMIEMTKPGGLIIISTRLAYYETTDYQQVSDQLELARKIKLLKVEKNQPYTDDSPAHYWAYTVL